MCGQVTASSYSGHVQRAKGISEKVCIELVGEHCRRSLLREQETLGWWKKRIKGNREEHAGKEGWGDKGEARLWKALKIKTRS